MRRRWVVGATALVAVGGCSSQEASPATLPPVATSLASETTDPSVTSTPGTTIADDATTEPGAPSTAVPSTAPPATAPPTTTRQVGTPVAASIPLFVGGADGGWLLLGTWASTAWEPAVDDDGTPIAPDIPAGSTLAITGLQAGATSGVTGPIVEACFDGRVGPTIDAAVNGPVPPGFGYSAIALPAIWPLQPRPVVTVDAAIPAYAAAGQEIFAGAPVDASRGDVEQIVLADLDGDGDEEALVAFEHVDPSAIVGAPGDLSAVLMIDTATGDSTPIGSSFVGPPPTPPSTLPGSPSTTVPAAPLAIIERFRILGVADLNGDGVMEVAVHTWYYEGAAVIVYGYDGTSLVEVLSTGCGA